MTVKVSSIGLKGLEGYRVQVEVQISSGTESMKESKERVLSAISLKKFLISKLFCILYMLNGPI